MALTIFDLVTPLAGAQSRDDDAVRSFRAAHATTLAALWRQRAPWDHGPAPLPTVTRETLARCHDSALHPRIHDVVRAAGSAGLGVPALDVVLFVGLGHGDVVDALPHPRTPQVVLALDRLETELACDVALARGLALIARWQVRALPTPTPWDRLAAAAQVPLAEWVYAEGLAQHLVATLHPGIAPHQRLGIARAGWDLLRQRESALLDALEDDLPRHGLGPWARWFDPAPPVPDGPDTVRPPRGAIGYLAWRLLEDRVGRVGLTAAAGMEA